MPERGDPLNGPAGEARVLVTARGGSVRFARLDEDDLEFKTVVSVEKDRAAHRTLTLRAF